MRTGKLLSHVDERWPKGRRLVVAGWALRLAGAVLGVTGWLAFKTGWTGDQLPAMLHPAWWLRGLGSLVAVGVALRIFGTGRHLVVQGKRYTAEVIDSFGALAGTRYVLYLRPFSNDADMSALETEIQGGGTELGAMFFLSGLTREEQLVHRFGLLGRVIAVGRPGERLPDRRGARAVAPR